MLQSKAYAFRILFIIFGIIFANNLYGQSVILRTNTTVGGYFSKDMTGLSYSYGLKAMLTANDKQRYGIKVDNIVFVDNNDSNVSNLSVGIFLEQVLYRYFNMGIGTVGYINLSNSGYNPFGIYTHLGFEYPLAKRYHFLLGYESDFIFGQPFTTNASFQVGIGVKI